MLLGYLYLVVAPWLICDLTQLLPFLWPTCIHFVCIIHFKAAVEFSTSILRPFYHQTLGQLVPFLVLFLHLFHKRTYGD